MARKPLIYFADGRWNCSIKLPSALVVGHGATPLDAWGNMHTAISADPKLLPEWVDLWLVLSADRNAWDFINPPVDNEGRTLRLVAPHA